MKQNEEIIFVSFHFENDDLDYTPFYFRSGRGKMYYLFDDEVNNIIEELNKVLIA